MNKECAITTIDNPFNPFNDFENWNRFDEDHGYFSCQRVMRLANITNDMTTREENEEFERAIDKLISIDFLNIFKKVYKD